MPDYIGQRLGNYRILKLLGEGGFAQVYLGEHIYLKTTAAIKISLTNLSENDLQAFLNEARTVAHLRHVQIVRILEFGVTDDHVPFLAMTYAPHGTLRQRHPHHTLVPLEYVISYVKQVATALQFAHDQRLIHRDIKPENMLLGLKGEILLSDFGIAITARNTLSQEKEKISGTIFYMAPEQLQGRSRPASDQYSLGAVVYEWLCGAPPFTGDSFLGMALKHLQTPPPPLHDRVSVSPAIEAVVLRALAKDPAERFPDVQSFANALAAAGEERGSLSYLSTVPLLLAVIPSQSPPPESFDGDERVNLSAQAPTDPDALIRDRSESSGIHAQGTLRSRRAVMTGLIGIAGLSALGGTLAWYTHSSQKLAPPQVTPTPAGTGSSLLMRSPGTTLFTYNKHTSSVTSVSWSPHGAWVASASNDKTIHAWQASTTGTPLAFVYSKHTDKVETVAWSPDGTSIASASLDKTVRVWTAPSERSKATPGTTLVVYQGGTQIVPMAAIWSPDSKHIAMTTQPGYSQIQIWDADSGKQAVYYFDPSQDAPTPDLGPAGALAWSPNGALLVTNIITVALWDIASGDRLLTYNPNVYDIQSAVHGLAWSPDSKHVALAGANKVVQIWEAATGNTTVTYKGHEDAVYAVSWSPDGKYLASASRDKTVQIWEAATGALHLTYRGHTAPVNTVSWSSDSRHLASGGDDNKVLIWQGI